MEGEFLEREIKWLLKEKYQGRLTPEAKKDIGRLKKGEPLAYLIGDVSFLGCTIDLKTRPLIPRPETEYWTEIAIRDIKKYRPAAECLDIFSGSGCIGVAVLKNVPQSKVDFAEVNQKFLEQIKVNLKINKINPKRYNLIESDIFQNIPQRKRYDYILANPPYLAESKKNLTQKSVLQYEPNKALFAGRDGLNMIKRFLRKARSYLKEEGKIYLEFDSWQKEKIKKVLIAFGYRRYDFFKDQYGRWRFLVLSHNVD